MNSRLSAGLLLLACLAPLRSTSAQYGGFSLGMNWATVDWQYPKSPSGCRDCITDASPHDFRKGIAPGVQAAWRASDSYGFDSEVRFTPKGFGTTQPTLVVDYLEVPLLLRAGRLTSPHSPLTFFAETGPAFALRVMCSVDYNGVEDDCKKGAAFGQDWRIRRFDVSEMSGIGVSIRSGESLLLLGARIDWGFVNIGSTGQGVPTKNRSALLYAALMWPPKSK